MNVDCLQCRALERIALDASRAYHELLADLEAAHIRHDLEATSLLSVRLKKAFQRREMAVNELTAHESTHVNKKPLETRQLSKRKSA